MDYAQIINEIQKLDFISDRSTAEAACKAVWGIIASTVDESLARELTSQLPGDLTEEKLRGHQVRELEIDPENFIQEISTQFDLDLDQASTLTQKAIQLGEQTLQADTLSKLRKSVPQNMTALI